MDQTNEVINLGTGGNALDILDTLHDLNAQKESAYQCLGFMDDNPDLWRTDIAGLPVLGGLDQAPRFPDCSFINGIGSPANFYQKSAIIAKTGLLTKRFITLVHPSASVSRTALLGRGTVVFQNVTITSQVTIGNHVIILPNTVISHHDIIGDYTCIAGGVCISGNVHVGACCYLGSNASIIGNISIGKHCLIGIGAVVLHPVEPNSVIAGNPARFLRHTL